ncbi:N-acetyl-gamma-glutamyl-phosphate reductase [Halobacteriales archaeon QS_9_67_17]|nr:MAG: N-acetyl-gamma-glutamyl-phosphate reductase [Halobacteriales archaeon QS_9_67_17]
MKAGVVGASGFTGGELCRLIDGHPEFDLAQATSREYANKTVGHVHPNLRHLDVRFSEPDELESVDVLFAATPHGVSMSHIDAFRDAADTVVDLSADFRLPNEAAYDEWYDGHERPELLADAEYALPELNRENLPGADLIAAGGCNATASILGLLPLFEANPERSGVVRPYAPTGHRHEAEIAEFLGFDVSFTVHAVDMIRGASATCHVFPEEPVSKGDLWGAYRGSYEDEPFVRLASGGGGVYRYPEPKAVAGSNVAEVGFELDPANRRLVVFSAIDNMMKGSAGQAVHAANIALGLDETAGLETTGLHPVGAP